MLDRHLVRVQEVVLQAQPGVKDRAAVAEGLALALGEMRVVTVRHNDRVYIIHPDAVLNMAMENRFAPATGQTERQPKPTPPPNVETRDGSPRARPLDT